MEVWALATRICFEITNAYIGSKRQARLFASVLWKPFNIRFDDIIERMGSHQEIIGLEITLHVLRD
jgi:hypothetical protein